MSVRQFPMPRWPNSGKYMWCKWCGDEIPRVIDGRTSGQRMWHPTCLHEYNLHTRLEVQFRHLVERDGRRCQLCPEDSPEPMKWNRTPWPIQIVNGGRWRMAARGRESEYWDDPAPDKSWADKTEIERHTGEYYDVDLVSALEVDHRVPLWEVASLPDDDRRWYFGPANLWLLCPAHHREKSARESARRAVERRTGRGRHRGR